MNGASRITQALREVTRRPALMPFLTAGFPTRSAFAGLLRSVRAAGDVVEVGVPFSDPMADGVTIQRASHAALEDGATLRWILTELAGLEIHSGPPVVLMSYFNPVLSHGLEELARDSEQAGVCGIIIPDLPLEESEPARVAFSARGLALVQMVTPATPRERRRTLAEASQGFLYAVTVTGTTGGASEIPAVTLHYLESVRAISPVPVCAGFGIRHPHQIRALAPHIDGVIVGSAVLEAVQRGDDPGTFLKSLRATSQERRRES